MKLVFDGNVYSAAFARNVLTKAWTTLNLDYETVQIKQVGNSFVKVIHRHDKTLQYFLYAPNFEAVFRKHASSVISGILFSKDAIVCGNFSKLNENGISGNDLIVLKPLDD